MRGTAGSERTPLPEALCYSVGVGLWFDFSSTKATHVQPPVMGQTARPTGSPLCSSQAFSFPALGKYLGGHSASCHLQCASPAPSLDARKCLPLHNVLSHFSPSCEGFCPPTPPRPPPFFFARNTLLPKDTLGFCRRTAVTETKHIWEAGVMRADFFF